MKKLVLDSKVRIVGLLILFVGFLMFGSTYESSKNNPDVLSSTSSNVDKLKDNIAVPTLDSLPVPNDVKEQITFDLNLSAKSAVVKDFDGNTYFSKNPNEKHALASTTKIMTALVALDSYDLDDVVEIPFYCTTVETQKVGFFVGEKLTVRALITSMLIFSGADSACALQYKESEPHLFINAMNEKAKELGMINTNFTNVVGYDEIDHYSSAEDLYYLGLEAMKHEDFAKIVGYKETTIVSVDGQFVHQIGNTNQLLFTRNNVFGIKTGFTDFAKDCLVFAYEVNGKKYIGTILGSDDRFADAELIIAKTEELL